MTTRFTYSPSAWRLGLRKGELILQSGSCWVQGSKGGVEWSDVPTVNLDSPMTPLSPVAQAVLDAAYALPLKNGQPNIAAALRAAADQVVPPSGLPPKSTKERFLYIEGYKDSSLRVREKLLAIATELESCN